MSTQPKQLTNIIINGENYLVSDETVQTLLEVIWNNNGAISSRINDLNQRILTNTNDIEDNAYVTAIALNDLNDRINNSSSNLDSLEIAYENLKSYVLTTYNNINTSYNRLYSYTTVQLGNINTGYNNLKSYVLSTYNNVKTSYEILKKFMDDNIVQSDWNEGSTSSTAYIKNKPYIPTKVSDLTNDSDYATKTYVRTEVSNLVNSAPATLDTLNELAAALGNDPNFATTVATQIGNINTAYNNLKSYVLATYNNVSTSYNILNDTVTNAYSYLLNAYLAFYEEYDRDSYLMTKLFIQLHENIEDLNNNTLPLSYISYLNSLRTDVDDKIPNSYKSALDNCFNDKLSIVDYNNDSYVIVKSLFDLNDRISYLNTDYLSSYAYLNSRINETQDYLEDSTYVIANSLIDLDTRIDENYYEIIDSYNALKTYTTVQIGNLNTGYSNLESYILTSYNNIKISYDTLASRVNTMQGLYIPLAGNTTSDYVSGTINFYDNAGRDIIKINSVNKKTYIWNIVGNRGSWNNQYGFSELYNGTEAGNNNSLILWAHNQSETHQKVRTILQDGTLTIHKLATFEGQIKSTLATGTMPLNVTSTTLNTNLNADMLDDKHASYFIDLINENANDIEEYSYVTAVALNDLNDRLIDSYDYAINSYTYAIDNIDYLTANSIPIAKAKIFGTTSQLLSYSFDIDDYGYDDDKSYLVKCVSSSPLALSVVDSYIHVSYVVNDSLWYWDKVTLYPMSELFEVVQRNAYITSISLSDLNRRVLLLEEQLLSILSYNSSTLSNNYGIAQTKRKLTEAL